MGSSGILEGLLKDILGFYSNYSKDLLGFLKDSPRIPSESLKDFLRILERISKASGWIFVGFFLNQPRIFWDSCRVFEGF